MGRRKSCFLVIERMFVQHVSDVLYDGEGHVSRLGDYLKAGSWVDDYRG